MEKNILENFRKFQYDDLTTWYENDSDEIVCTIWNSINTPFHGGRKILIGNVYVSPFYRKKGLCKDMLDYVTSKFKDDIFTLSVSKNNIRAIEIYKKYGFKTYSSDDKDFYMILNKEGNKND